jgi:TolA-binding protein
VYAPSPAAEKALRQIREKSSHREVRGQATFSLAQYLKHNSQTAEAEKLYAEVIEKYGEVSHYRGDLGDAAKSALFEIRNLAIGKVAPEIEGEDVDGKRFKLSDYRGKVVVLDFWGDW